MSVLAILCIDEKKLIFINCRPLVQFSMNHEEVIALAKIND